MTIQDIDHLLWQYDNSMLADLISPEYVQALQKLKEILMLQKRNTKWGDIASATGYNQCLSDVWEIIEQ